MKKSLLFISSFGLASLTLVISASCSKAVTFNLEFIGEHLTFKGEGSYASGETVLGNISPEEGYQLPSEINVVGAKEYTYNPSNGDVSIVLTHNTIIEANACYSFKFYGNECLATGEGFTSKDSFDLRFPCTRTVPLNFELTVDEDYLLPLDIDIKFNGREGEIKKDYIYETSSKTLEILNLTSNIEARISADSTFPLNCNLEHYQVIGAQSRYRKGAIVDFRIKAEEGYQLPETINVIGVNPGDYSYNRDDNHQEAVFALTGGMPNNQVMLNCVPKIYSYDVNISDTTNYELDFVKINHGQYFANTINIKSKSNVSLPADIAITNNGNFLDKNQYIYNSTTGKIYIAKNIINGPIYIFTNPEVKSFPFVFTSGIATANNRAEYSYGTQTGSSFKVTLKDGYKYPILNYEVTNLNQTDYSFNLDTGDFTLNNMPAALVNLKVTEATPQPFLFTCTTTNCHFVDKPQKSYPYGSEVRLQLEGNEGYGIPHSIIVNAGLKSNEYTYNPKTGVLLIPHMPANSVLIDVESTNKFINIDNSYRIVIDKSNRLDIGYAEQINEAIKYYLGYTLDIVDEDEPSVDKEIIVNSNRMEAIKILQTLDDNHYCIDKTGQKVVVVAKGGETNLSKMCVIDRLLTDYINEDGFKLPIPTLITGECSTVEAIKDFKVNAIDVDRPTEMRDPFIVEQKKGDGTNRYDYYLYGTIDGGDNYWQSFKCENEISTSTADWKPLGECCEHDEVRISDSRWAPEVYEYTYQGKKEYYMFTTYRNQSMDYKGVTVMKSSSLDPSVDKFKIISYDNNKELGWLTPQSKSSVHWYIDGSLYVDDNQTPWVILVDNFRRTPDGHGRMAVAMLSQDLTHIVSNPIEIFNAHDVSWVGPFDQSHYITDGPFVYRTKSGKLLMQWSSYTNESTGTDPDNFYGIGFATSENGSMLGPWKQHDRLLFERGMYKQYMGGHGEFFMDHSSNQLYMCFHSPNSQDETPKENEEHPLLIPIKEAYDTIVWDIYQH